jgi:hypothetical protein
MGLLCAGIPAGCCHAFPRGALQYLSGFRKTIKDMITALMSCPIMADFVAKVVLHWGSKILREQARLRVKI